MRTGWMLSGLLALSGAAWGADDGRYQAFPLSAAESGRTGARAFVIDSRDGHVWVWSENELITAPDGSRRYGSVFVYQGKLRPGSQAGEILAPPSR